jgi:imidazole glycerol phosphate synthase subunit HisF
METRKQQFNYVRATQGFYVYLAAENKPDGSKEIVYLPIDAMSRDNPQPTLTLITGTAHSCNCKFCTRREG